MSGIMKWRDSLVKRCIVFIPLYVQSRVFNIQRFNRLVQRCQQIWHYKKSGPGGSLDSLSTTNVCYMRRIVGRAGPRNGCCCCVETFFVFVVCLGLRIIRTINVESHIINKLLLQFLKNGKKQIWRCLSIHKVVKAVQRLVPVQGVFVFIYILDRDPFGLSM